MRIVYFGTSDFAVPALEAVKDSVVLVVSQPDRPSGRGMESRPSPIKAKALELGLPFETPEKSRSPDFVERIRSLKADVLLVAAYGQILSVDLLSSAMQGGVNLHGSILPKYRGAAPVQRCVQSGETETGVTLMQMAQGMDTGDIIATKEVGIGPDTTSGALSTVLASLAAELAAKWMPRICRGEYPRTPQDDTQATYAPKVDKSEAELKFDRDAMEEFCRYRAFTPSPGAFLRTAKGQVKIGRAALTKELDPGPGIVGTARPMLALGFQKGSIALIELQPEGKKKMSGADWANGARIAAGDCLLP